MCASWLGRPGDPQAVHATHKVSVKPQSPQGAIVGLCEALHLCVKPTCQLPPYLPARSLTISQSVNCLITSSPTVAVESEVYSEGAPVFAGRNK